MEAVGSFTCHHTKEKKTLFYSRTNEGATKSVEMSTPRKVLSMQKSSDELHRSTMMGRSSTDSRQTKRSVCKKSSRTIPSWAKPRIRPRPSPLLAVHLRKRPKNRRHSLGLPGLTIRHPNQWKVLSTTSLQRSHILWILLHRFRSVGMVDIGSNQVTRLCLLDLVPVPLRQLLLDTCKSTSKTQLMQLSLPYTLGIYTPKTVLATQV